MMISSTLEESINEAINGAQTLSERRKQLLQPFIDQLIRTKDDQLVNLIFICIHNSRRSHLAQIWGQVAAHYYGLEHIHCYSGGTEATAIYPSIARTLEDEGLQKEQLSEGKNPVISFKYAENETPIIGFSKKYDHPFNPQSNYTAIMVCAEAGEMCPYIPEAAARIVLPYEDPKVFDGTDQEALKYAERSLQIATEMFYVFQHIK